MRPPLIIGLSLLAACAEGGSPRLDQVRWVDLTHDFSDEAIYWPTAESFHLTVVSAAHTPGGYYYAANNFSAAEHGGTHVDAPIHFAEGKLTTDRIPLQSLIGPAVVVDIAAQAAASADYRLTVADLEAWERAHERLAAGTIVLVRTGWSARWPDRAQYLGTARVGPEAVAELHFPGIDSAAARWLVARGARAVGIDTPSLDYGQSSTYDSHRILFAADIPGFENVAHLDELPVRGAWIVALPMKIKGGSGGPLRIVAAVGGR